MRPAIQKVKEWKSNGAIQFEVTCIGTPVDPPDEKNKIVLRVRRLSDNEEFELGEEIALAEEPQEGVYNLTTITHFYDNLIDVHIYITVIDVTVNPPKTTKGFGFARPINDIIKSKICISKS